MSRTYTFGQVGSSGGWFYVQYLEKMVLNEANIDWSGQNVDYLLMDKYDEYMREIIENAKKIKKQDLTARNIKRLDDGQDVVIYYKDLDEYGKMSSMLKLMQDHKFGLPRQSYRGIVIVNWNKHRIIFVPKNIDWRQRGNYQVDRTNKRLYFGDAQNSIVAKTWNLFSGQQ